MSGIELIVQERERQLNELNIPVENDVHGNDEYQLSFAASRLSTIIPSHVPPKGWDIVIWRKMVNKGYKKRLVIAGALIAAEIDRLEAVYNKKEF